MGVLPLARAQVPADTTEVTLQTVLERALLVSPDLGMVRADQEFAEARSNLARSSRYFTDFTGTSAFSVSPGLTNPNNSPVQELYLDPNVRNDFSNLRPFTHAEVELVQPLYTWGQLGGSIEAAAYGVDVEKAGVRGKELEVALRAAELYYSVLLTNDLHRLIGRAGDVVQQAMNEINRLLEEGNPDVDEADRYQVLLTEQEFIHRSQEVTEKRQIAQVALRRQLQKSTYIIPAIEGLRPLSFVPESMETYFAMALQQRPEIAQSQAGLAAHDALLRVARADYYPQIVIGVSASVSYTSNRQRQPNPFIRDSFRRSTARSGFGFQQKLNFSQTRARVAQAEAARKKVRYQMDGIREVILLEVERAYRDVLVAHTAMMAQDSSLAITKEWLRVEYINFDLELGNTENLIKAVQANLEVEARYYESVWRYNMVVLGLLRAVGILIHSMENSILVE